MIVDILQRVQSVGLAAGDGAQRGASARRAVLGGAPWRFGAGHGGWDADGGQVVLTQSLHLRLRLLPRVSLEQEDSRGKDESCISSSDRAKSPTSQQSFCNESVSCSVALFPSLRLFHFPALRARLKACGHANSITLELFKWISVTVIYP